MVKGEGSERPKGPITSHAKTNTTLHPSTRRLPPLQARSPTSTDSLRPSSSSLLGACSRAVLPLCKAAILHQACVDFARTLLAQSARPTTSATRLHWEKLPSLHNGLNCPSLTACRCETRGPAHGLSPLLPHSAGPRLGPYALGARSQAGSGQRCLHPSLCITFPPLLSIVPIYPLRAQFYFRTYSHLFTARLPRLADAGTTHNEDVGDRSSREQGAYTRTPPRTHYPPTSRRGVRYVRGVSAAWWERDSEGAYVPSALSLFFNHIPFPFFVPSPPLYPSPIRSFFVPALALVYAALPPDPHPRYRPGARSRLRGLALGAGVSAHADAVPVESPYAETARV
ncbi:hypothetical protein C8F04DRAFT_1349911 [Mycena alexandri]|uniref:Uncharacterized protein n=1 Tax=Mycena alexandri TaxID=1745969 RepID=A0AAD6WLZ7_9AGAR|nr:hypothetical protein C8F04DRAFT_1349911 [Mycena alexandri]